MSRELCVTVKYGKGYDESWVVFRGLEAEVREDIASVFGLSEESTEGLTLSEIVVNATSVAHGKMTAVAGLGGTVIAKPPADAPTSNPKADEAQVGNAAWDAAESGEPAANPLLASIEAATDVPALQRLYAENTPALAGTPELLKAWKAKGKSLTTAAA